ncbi:MAG: DUF1499 domain-containing protein [Cypionkella sp.]
MKTGALLFILLLAGIASYIRLAPSNADEWNAALPATGPLTDCTRITAEAGGASVSCAAPENALTRLDVIALATPRTRRLAGSAQDGRVTWITRSKLWGFPDYTTAQMTQTAIGPRLDIHARLRFGRSDTGVNAARLRAWISQL